MNASAKTTGKAKVYLSSRLENIDIKVGGGRGALAIPKK